MLANLSSEISELKYGYPEGCRDIQCYRECLINL